MKVRQTTSTLLFTLLVSSRVLAQSADSSESVDDLDLVKLLNVEVSTATKTAEAVDDAPAVITVVTRDDIARWGYQSVAEVLTHTVGFYLIDDGILPDAGVRGMTGGLGAESGLIKVMIDGRSVAYRTTSGNWLGVELVPLTSVEQIEIIRGPASALYGADAFLGVVNIITIKPDRLRPLRVNGAAGLTATNLGGRVEATSGWQSGQFDLLLGVAGEHTDRSGLALPAESPAPVLPSDIGSRRTALNLKRDSLVLQGRVGYRVPETGELVLSSYFSGLKRGGDFAHWAQLTNESDAQGRRLGTVVALQQLRLNLSGLLHLTHELDLAAESTYFQGGLLPDDRIEIGSPSFYAERHQSYRGTDSFVEARWVPSPRFNAIAGVETVYDHERLGAPSLINRATESPVTTDAELSTQSLDLFNVGGYLSVNLKVIEPWLKLTGGLRYDRHSEYGDQVSGRLGATSRFSKAIVSKLLYGSAFKAPSPYTLHATPLGPGDVIGNAELSPQHIHTVEYQVSYKPGRFWGVTSGISYSWLLNKAEFTPQGNNQTARNIASQRSLAWETRADLRHYDDYRAYLGFDWVYSRRDLGRPGYVAELVGTQNVIYPSWIARMGAIVGVPSLPNFPLELGAEGLLVGPRRASETTLVAAGGELVFPSYFLLDLSLASRRVYLVHGSESRFAVRARNLLLARGPDPGPAGFEYPLRPGEIFFEFEHVY